jgi:hypothetical protein
MKYHTRERPVSQNLLYDQKETGGTGWLFVTFFGMTQQYAPLIDDYAACTSSMCVCMKSHFPALRAADDGCAGEANTAQQKFTKAKQPSHIALCLLFKLSLTSSLSKNRINWRKNSKTAKLNKKLLSSSKNNSNSRLILRRGTRRKDTNLHGTTINQHYREKFLVGDGDVNARILSNIYCRECLVAIPIVSLKIKFGASFSTLAYYTPNTTKRTQFEITKHIKYSTIIKLQSKIA